MDVSRLFSVQRRRKAALASSVAALETLLAQEGRLPSSAEERTPSTCIDALLLSHPFTDHAHPATLVDRTLPLRIPLLVSSHANAALPHEVRGRDGERRVVMELPHAHAHGAPDVVHRTSPLPSNIRLFQTTPQTRLPAFLRGPPGLASQKLHGAIIVLWTRPPSRQTYALLYTPHGAVPSSIPAWLSSPAIEATALLTLLDTITLPRWLTNTVNLGLPGALPLLAAGPQAQQPAFAARYLLDTHGEHKEARGLVAHLLRRYSLGHPQCLVHPCHDAQEQHKRQEAQRIVDEAVAQTGRTTKVLYLDVGQTVSL